VAYIFQSTPPSNPKFSSPRAKVPDWQAVCTGYSVDSPTGNPNNRPQRVQENPASDDCSLNTARRILHRQDSAELVPAESVQSVDSLGSSLALRLKRYLAQNVPTSIADRPVDGEELPASEAAKGPRDPAAELKTEAPKDSPETHSEFMAVRCIRLAAKDAIEHSQAVYREIETKLEDQAQDLERRQAALSSAAESVSASLQQLQQKIAKDFADELEKVYRALLTRLPRQLEEHAGPAVAALNERLGAEKQRPEQPASVSGTSTESVTRDLNDQVRAEVTTSQHALIQETQSQLTEMTLLSLQRLQTLGRTCVEQVKADLTDSRKTFIDETQRQLADITEALLESLVKSSVQQGRRELSRMVNEFLVNGISRIEAELRRVIDSSVHTQVPRWRITDGP
jgi:hypothetical protein